ncbi:MAG: hypothetical protein MI757_00215 [Pirellulales bacterium]|nr:hypothetical protein [Pirellulales bacterium]
MRRIRTRRHGSPDGVGYRFRVVSLVFFLSAVAADSRGQNREDPVRVAHLIDRLGSSSFARRQSAERELLGLGQRTMGPLQKAASGDDPEVRLRAEKLLDELKVRRLWSASMIDCKSEDQLASVVLREAAHESENKLVFGGRFDNFVDRDVQVDPGRKEYWRVVDQVCRQTENHLSFRRQAETGATVIVAGKPGKYPVAYAGPLRVFLKQAKREFSESFDYEDGTTDIGHTFAIELAANWETRCKLLAYQSDAYVVAATTEKGQRLLTAPGSSGGWSVVQPGVGQIETTLRLQPPSVAASKLKELHLRWNLVAAGDPRTIELSDLATPRVYRQDDVELVFEGIVKQTETSYEASFVVARGALIAELKDLGQSEYHAAMLDDTGKRMPIHSRNVESSTNSRRETPFAVEGTRIIVTFLASSAERKPAKLRFTYPKIRSRKALDIVFRDVRLPATPLD